jgi:drug/metabolite transporter (DMT)-like permease
MTGTPNAPSLKSLHFAGVASGLAAGAWLGASEAPTKLVHIGLSPFLISLGMVMGVFVARWTVPVILKGSNYVWADLREKPHLIIWGLVAGMIWAVANTLTVFAIRDVGLAVAFPLWNINSLISLFWGWLLFNELRGAGRIGVTKVLGGAAAIVVGAIIIAYATTSSQTDPADRQAAMLGIAAALGAGLLWGTMCIPYRKAYISGMNPLSFVTVFTFGELGTMIVLLSVFDGGLAAVAESLDAARPVLFWLFLGGFFWVIGDLFQQYAAKYIGIGRGIPLSNTNQLWGLAWGVLVFGEFVGMSLTAQIILISGSIIMIFGAAAISVAEPPDAERSNWRDAMNRECDRYGLDRARTEAMVSGEDPLAITHQKRRPWEYLVVIGAVGIFVWLAMQAERPALDINGMWMIAILGLTLGTLVAGGLILWKRTRFS